MEAVVTYLDAGQNLVGLTACRVRGDVGVEDLRRAVQGVAGRHPALRVCIQDGRFVEHDALPDVRVEQAGLEALMEDQLNRPFDAAQGPLVRFVTSALGAGETALAVAYHHAVADGVSGRTLIVDTLRALAGEHLSRRDELPDVWRTFPEHPARTSLADAAADAARAVRARLRHGKIAHAYGANRGLGGRTYMRLLNFDQATAAGLKRFCRSRQLTVHDTLTATVLHAVADSSGGTRLVCANTPTSLRTMANLRSDDVTYAAGAVLTFHTIGPGTTIATTAREVHGRVRTMQEAHLDWYTHAFAWRTHGILKLVLRTPQRYAAAVNAARLSATGVTNLGVAAVPDVYGPRRLLWLHGTSNTWPMGEVGTAASSFAGGLAWSLTASERALGREAVDTLASRLEASIAQLALGGAACRL